MRRFLVALSLLLLPLLIGLLPHAAHAQYYVCTTQANCVNNAVPSDASSNCSTGGTFAAPFATIGHAQTVMRACSTKKTILEGGTYSLGANLTFTTSDNGTSYVAYPGSTPIISGGGSPGTGNFLISASGAINGLTFKGITFLNLGTDAAGGHNGGFQFTSNGTQNLTFQYNSFVNCQDHCISMARPSNVLVDSNTFTSSAQTVGGAELGDALLIWNGNQSNVTFSHNICQYMGFACFAQSSSCGSPPCTETPGPSNVIVDSNIVVNACLSQADCGALYFDDRSGIGTGNKITNNVVSGVNQGQAHNVNLGTNNDACIYLDDMTSNVTVTGNLCYNDPGNVGILYHGGQNNTVNNNVFVMSAGTVVGYYQAEPSGSWCGSGSPTCPMAGNTFQNNIVWWLGAPNNQHNGPWATSGAGSFGSGPNVSGNLYYWATTQVQNAQIGGPTVVDSSPVQCGPSMGGTLAGGLAATRLYQSIAQGVVGSWLPLAINQGPTFRNCSTGF